MISLAWFWFAVAVAGFTWATWLHGLLVDLNNEVARLRGDRP